MSLTFRNLDVDPSEPVDHWPYEGIVTAIERGSVHDWARLSAEIRRRPFGAVAEQVEEYLGYAQPYGVGPLLDRIICSAREPAR